MLIAPIFPTRSVDLAPVTGYQLCFAELALEDDAYAAHFRERAEHETVTMDTLVYEGAMGVTPGELVEAVLRIHPNNVVVPDVIGDMAATMANFGRYASRLQQVWGAYSYLVGAPQGRTLAEFIQCTDMLQGLATRIAIGAETSNIVRSDRSVLAKLVYERTHKMPLMLGMRREYGELATIKDVALAMDSAKPVYYGLAGVKLSIASFSQLHRPPNYFDTPREDVIAALPLILRNIAWLQSQV